MGHTPVWGIPYPEPDMTPDGAGQMRALSEAVDAIFQYDRTTVPIKAGTNGHEAVADITFPSAFPAGSTPVIIVTPINTGYAAHVVINQISNTGFTVTFAAIPGSDGQVHAFPNDREITWLALAPRAAAGTP